ncbi:HTH-type transcriptional activator IlvY [Endozoicomonas sp. OPT23]|uniref:HTH-type transcriptional activator IlvY n=1 Tax=Endozoicomonas sp. OPT23 TaxID=2072845 RepID=UPI00129A4E68|nr:HTH-type transcriptional activator IlvY [Endozoicomonas sp. OPT23]MRI31740.1 HTH-type transcriptional activator IlvY [Endozoicomonas sp. OPT23]
MDTKSLHHFLSLAETLHFGRASAAAHVSPSTLSRSIQQLEEKLGVVLFERDNRTVSLTPEGQKFETYARETISQWATIRNELMAESTELKGEISVYCSVTASYSFLYEILNRFRQHYPKIEIKLHTGDPDSAIEHVMSGKEDVVVSARPEQMPSDLRFHSIGLSPLTFIAPANDEISIPETNEDWAQTPMILSERGIGRQRVDSWFASKKITPRIYSQVAGNEAIVSMVSLGFGIGVVPQIVLDNSPLADRVRVLDVKPWLAAYDVGICVLEKKLKSPLIQAFWELLETR